MKRLILLAILLLAACAPQAPAMEANIVTQPATEPVQPLTASEPVPLTVMTRHPSPVRISGVVMHAGPEPGSTTTVIPFPGVPGK